MLYIYYFIINQTTRGRDYYYLHLLMEKWRLLEVSVLLVAQSPLMDRPNSNKSMSGASVLAINPEVSQKVRPQVGLPDKLQNVQVN